MNIEFKHDNIFIKAEINFPNKPNKTYAARCTCGYHKNNINAKEFAKLEACPKCNVKTHKTMGNNYAYSSYTNTYIVEYKFTPKRGYLKTSYLYATIRDVDYCATGDLVFDNDISEFIFEYEENKKGKKVYKPKLIRNGDSSKLLKGSLDGIMFPSLYNSPHREILSELDASSTDYSFKQILWGIHNRYKYLTYALSKGIYFGYGSRISDLVNFEAYLKKYFNDNNIQYVISFYNYFKAERAYRKMDFWYVDHYFNLDKVENAAEKIELKKKALDTSNFLLKNKEALENVGKTDVSFYINEYTDMMIEYDFTFEELIEFFALAERQAFSGHINVIANGYKIYKELGIPINKKPKELAIYVQKMTALKDLISSYSQRTYYPPLDKYLIYKPNKDVVKYLYEKEGYKILDELLIRANMNKKEEPFYMNIEIEDKQYPIEDVIAFTNFRNRSHQDAHLTSLLLKDGTIIENPEDIAEFLKKEEEKIKAAIEKEREVEATC